MYYTNEHKNKYNRSIAKYEAEVKELQNEMIQLDENFRHDILGCEKFLNIMQRLPSTYAKANFVQKQLIAKMLDLNIKINDEKRLTITVNPIFDDFFTHNGGRRWTGTIDLFLIREAL